MRVLAAFCLLSAITTGLIIYWLWKGLTYVL